MLINNNDPISAFWAHHNNHTTFHDTGLQRSRLIYLKFRNTIQHNTIHQDLCTSWIHHEHWQHTTDNLHGWPWYLGEALPYLVFAEGVLDLPGCLAKFSLFGIRQCQLGQVTLLLVVGGIEERSPFCGALEAKLPKRTFDFWLSSTVYWAQARRGS